MKRSSHRLTKITIKGFKSIAFEKPITLEIGDVNILLGANGAGKSNIVSFFKMIGYMMTGSLQQFIAKSGTNQKFLYYGAKKTPTLSAEIRFDGNNSFDIYRFYLTNAVPNRLIVTSEEIEWKSTKDKISKKIQLRSDFNESALVNHKGTASNIVWDILSGCKVYQFCDSSAESPMRQTSPKDSANYLQSEANNLASFLLFLKGNYRESYERIVSYIREVVPQFKDFYLEPDNGYVSLKWIDSSANDYVLSSDQFSDGSIRFIALATLLLQPEETMPRVIIIDEPELGLHPYAIDQLIEMIKDASLHAQIIVATQSPALIDGFDANDVTVIERDEDNQCTIAKKLNAQDYSEWLEEYTLSELWNKNVIGGRPL
ncbi:MAG: AAA family ATPase [Bacteroidales bacterium]|nr:AAA family ATPase [Bacteroidales bacterium]